MSKRFWEEIIGFTTENEIDKRYILREEGDSRAYGSLRVVSHPDLKPGYLKAIWIIVTSRKPKTKDEIIETAIECDMSVDELEVYSINEHITTEERIFIDTKKEIEKIFQIKLFK